MSRQIPPAARRGTLSVEIGLAATSLLLALPGNARAQSVDYPQLEEMLGEPVTTSVTGKPQRASETPAALVIITREDIKRSPARDLLGLVRAYAGIDVARWTAGQSDVSIRGGVQPYNSRLLVLVNGQQVYLDHYGMTNWAGIGVQLEDIQQIEIVRGPNSALFGFNAASGVINIITINPLQTEQLSATAEVGTRGVINLSGSAAFKLGSRLGARLSIGYGRSDELSGRRRSPVASPNGIIVTDPRQFQAAAEIYGKLSDQTEAAVGASYSSTRRFELIQERVGALTSNKFNAFGARISHDTGWGVVSARLYRNQADVYVPQEVIATGVNISNKVVVAAGEALFRAGSSNTFRAGIEFRENSLESSPGYPGATRYNVYAISGMWERVIGEAVTLTTAGRLDHLKLRQEGDIDQPTIYTSRDFDRSITAWSFNSALLFKVDQDTTLRAALARGIQAPSLFALGSRLKFDVPGLPVPLVLSGNPSLEPSILWSGEIGITRVLGRFSRLELNAFYNRTKNISSPPTPYTPPLAVPPAFPFILFGAQNVGSFEAFGLEASLAGHVGKRLFWSANYTWTRARQDIRGDTGTSFDWPVALDRSTPTHEIKAQVSYERGPWLGTVAARYSSATQQLVAINGPLQLFGIDDSLAIDARIGVKLGSHLTVEVAGENLTGSDAADLSPIAAERRLRATARVRF